jgi:hypothetical protein
MDHLFARGLHGAEKTEVMPGLAKKLAAHVRLKLILVGAREWERRERIRRSQGQGESLSPCRIS